MRALVVLAALVALGAVCRARAAPFTADEVKDHIRRESAAFAEIARAYQFQFTIVSTARSPAFPGGKVTESRVRLRQRSVHNLAEFLPPPDATRAEGEPKVVATNALYTFDLRRTDPARGWGIKEFRDLRDRDNSPIYFVSRGKLEPLHRGICPYWLAMHQWLPDYLERPWFNVRGVKPGDAGRVVVSYEFVVPELSHITQHGDITVDPANRWAVTHNDHRMSARGVTTRWVKSYEFEPVAGGASFVKTSRTEVTSDMPAAAGHTREDVATTTYVREEAADDEFYLSAFGLPEPVGLEPPSRRPAWAWLCGIAGACAVLMLAFAILNRRAARRAAAGEP